MIDHLGSMHHSVVFLYHLVFFCVQLLTFQFELIML